MGFISTVDYPAIEANWVAMGDNKAPMKFSTIQDRQLLVGPILIPDLPIYRFDEKTSTEYYVVFTKEVIEKLVRKFQAQQKTINLNYQHLRDSQLKNAVIQEIWLTGKVDKSQSLGFDLPEGSAFIAAHIGDKDFWEKEVKSGNVKGFSIEGFLDMEMKKLKKENMNQNFITAKTDKGEIKSDAESFIAGTEVYTEVDGTKTPCPDGDYVLENGSTLKVVGGKVSEVVEAEMSEEEIEVIQKAVKPLFEKLMATDKAEYEARIKELELKLSQIPGAKSYTESTDEPTKKPTAKQLVMNRFEILKKKSTELTK
jgi:hypothetical protein